LDPIVAHSRNAIREGSRSFSGASRVLPRATRESVHMLYAWCRHCDDRIDLQDLGRGAPSNAWAGDRRLADLREKTARVLEGGEVDEPAFIGLGRVVRRHGIPHRHPVDLLHGFAMDVEGRRYETLQDCLEYCYHVAGVVGVMMAYVMDASDLDALDRASDLGIALQMTNIARDVMDDASAGRTYLPLEWLDDAGVAADRIRDPANRTAVAGVVRRFLAEADRYYRSATQGLSFLAPRCAWAVAAARDVYREIGRVVVSRGEAAWDRRAYVSGPRKIGLALRAGPAAVWASVGGRAKAGPREGLWTRPQP
jgi:phytoene synthase